MQQVKVVVTVPESHAGMVRKAAADAGAGKTEHYSNADFSVRGIGRFRPLKGAKPAIGEIGKLEEVAEEQVWFTCAREKAKDVVAAIRSVHPYEEPAIDVYPLETL